MKDGVVTTVEQPLFVKKTHELASLLKKVKQGSAQAVDLLIDTMERPDDEVGLKIKVECAKTLIDYEVKITDQINKDQLMRQVAEIKAKGLSIPLLPGNDKPLPPTTDFKTIQAV